MKQFDCVEMMHRGGQALLAEVAAMTREERLARWQARHEELARRQEALRRARAENPPPSQSGSGT